MTKNQSVELLRQQLPGFYSVEQVIDLINAIEDSGDSSGDFNEDRQEDLKDAITEKVKTYINRLNNSDIVDFDSVELEIYGREVSVTDIEVNTDSLVDEVADAIDNVFESFFKPKELQKA